MCHGSRAQCTFMKTCSSPATRMCHVNGSKHKYNPCPNSHVGNCIAIARGRGFSKTKHQETRLGPQLKHKHPTLPMIDVTCVRQQQTDSNCKCMHHPRIGYRLEKRHACMNNMAWNMYRLERHKPRTTQTMRARPRNRIFIVKIFENKPLKADQSGSPHIVTMQWKWHQPRHESDKGSSPQQKMKRENEGMQTKMCTVLAKWKEPQRDWRAPSVENTHKEHDKIPRNSMYAKITDQ